MPEHAHPDPHHTGLALAQRGDLRAALPHLEEAATESPGVPAVWRDLALCRERLGDLAGARQAYERALALDPADDRAHAYLGDLLRQTGDLAAARTHLEQACRLRPGDPGHLDLLARLYLDRGEEDEAESLWRRALALAPEHRPSLTNLGALLKERERYEEAEALLRRALALAPDHPQTLNNLGITLRRLGRLEESRACLERGFERAPTDARLLINLALTRHELGDLEGALALLDTWVTRHPHDPQARWTRSLTLLTLERYARGWADYEAGLEAGERAPRALPIRRWCGEPLGGKRLLLLAEQGLGDQIMFLGCLPDLLQRAGPEAEIHLECDPRLAPLAARSFPSVRVHGTRPDQPWSGPRPAADFILPLGSLPLHFRRRAEDFPGRPYLVPDPERVAFWRRRYQDLGGAPVIGISWRGGNREDRHKRSLPLADWGPVFAHGDCRFVDLQYKGTGAERRLVASRFHTPLHHWPESDPFHKVDELAAQLAACDGYLGVANATAHLAGALGVPSLVLVPFVPSWRWGITGETTPWYTSVRLLRQPRPGDWGPVIREAARRLA